MRTIMLDDPSISIEAMPDGSCSLRLVGELSVFHAAKLHHLATQLAQERCDVTLDGEELLSVDLSVSQILLALQRAVFEQGRRFRSRGVSKELADLFALVGLQDEISSSSAGRDGSLAAAVTPIQSSLSEA